MTTRIRRLTTGVALATGISLVGVSVGGMASLDGELRAAAEQRPGVERVRIVDVQDCPWKRAADSRDA